MKAVTFVKRAVVLIAVIANISLAQDSFSPAPVQNSFFDNIVGNFKGEETQNGKQVSNTVNIRWGINHQYLLIDLKAVNKNDPKDSYEATGIWAADENGNVRTWWFDIYGANNVMFGTGKIEGNKITVSDKSNSSSSTWTLELEDNRARRISNGKYKTPDGSEIPFSSDATFVRN
jgi:hypothetical protein